MNIKYSKEIFFGSSSYDNGGFYLYAYCLDDDLSIVLQVELDDYSKSAILHELTHIYDFVYEISYGASLQPLYQSQMNCLKTVSLDVYNYIDSLYHMY